MSLRDDYEKYLVRREEQVKNPMGDYFLEQEKRYVHPFKIYGNIWFVGDSWVCIHLIDTGDGLMLIDSGNCGSTAMLVNAIWEAGFNPAHVKWIIHSHGHVDHFGGANFFKKMFGTKLYIGEGDAKMFRERPELSIIQDSANACDYLFEPDYEIKDGDILTFGNTTIQFYSVPGHSDGAVAIFFDVYENGDVKRCGYFGGFGYNTLQKDHLIEIGDKSYSMRQKYVDSINKVINEKVEIFLGNHCTNNKTLEKHEKQIRDPYAPNPFIDDKEWSQHLAKKRDGVMQMMKDDE